MADLEGGVTSPAFVQSWLDAPFAYQCDARYVAAARRVREARWAWVTACAGEIGDVNAWRSRVDRASAAYQAAVQLCREEEDRILNARRAVPALSIAKAAGGAP